VQLKPDLLLLLLLIVANGAPVLARLLLADRLLQPVDLGLRFLDSRPVLGPRKTWRGLIAALIMAPVTALALGLPAVIGMTTAIGAMAGDLLSSFIKRRLNVPPHGSVLGLDQVPESLVPLLLLQPLLDLDGRSIAAIVVGFSLAELLLTRLLTAFEKRFMQGSHS